MATLETTTANPTTQQEQEESQAAACWLNAHLKIEHGCADMSDLALVDLQVVHLSIEHGPESEQKAAELYREWLFDRLGEAKATEFLALSEEAGNA